MKKLLMAVMCCVMLVGCGGNRNATQEISQEQYESVISENESLKNKISELESQINVLNENIESEHSKEDGVTDNNTKGEEKTDSFDNLDESIEILAEYTLPDGIGWYTMHFMILENKSSETVDIDTSSLAYSADGTMVSAASASFNALGAGCKSIIYEAFETGEEIDHYDTEINISRSEYYDSVIQDLSFVQNDISGGAVFQVTNNGDNAAEFVEGYALFFSGEELVGYEYTYFTDDDSEIKPGKTISKQLTCRKEFDRIEFYMTGRR